jgi:putative ABC transport system substrate-binding protein
MLYRLGDRGPGAEAFRRGLSEVGYEEGRSISIEWRAHEGRREEDLAEVVAELVHLQPALIVTSGTAPTVAAKYGTSTIPIVMSAIGDPVALGLVSSLAHPGGNVTGTANLAPQLGGKRLQLLQDAVPGIARVAALVNGAIADQALDLRETVESARTLGIQLETVAVRETVEFEAAFARMRQAHVDGLVVLEDPLFYDPRNRQRIIELAGRLELPTMYPLREMVDDGGLMAYGPNFVDAHRRVAYYVDRILKGAKPADLPVEQPTKFGFVINLKTAQALGLTIPQHVLLQATEIIQ